MKKFPFVTAGIVVLALAAGASPDLNAALSYDRRLIMEGQWWRAVTAHLCHWSVFHLAVNLIIFIALCGYGEMRDRKRLAATLGITVAAVAAGFLWLMPKQAGYGGLSTLSFGILAGVAMAWLVGGKARGLLPGLVVAAVFLGGLAEVFAGFSLLAYAPPSEALEALPAAHLMAAVAGGLAAYNQRPGKAGSTPELRE